MSGFQGPTEGGATGDQNMGNDIENIDLTEDDNDQDFLWNAFTQAQKEYT